MDYRPNRFAGTAPGRFTFIQSRERSLAWYVEPARFPTTPSSQREVMALPSTSASKC